MNKTRCLYPGSFDPPTLGHMDIIRRAARMFDAVVVGVLHNPDKQSCFSVEQRVAMLEKACEGLENVEIMAYDGLLAAWTKAHRVRVVVRGVRGSADLENETMMARINAQLHPGLETVLLPAAPGKEQISASMVRQLAAFGADISPYVPKQALPDILAAFSHTGND